MCILHTLRDTHHTQTVRAHSAKADLCCYVLRTPTPQVNVL